MPTYNWYVCADLGIGPVPGLAGVYQRMGLCHPQGWQVQAYCIEPLKPPPPLNTSCARIDANTFWCGDEYQLLRIYEINETPTPEAPTRTPFITLPFTPTATSSATATFTATATATSTATATATPTIITSASPTPSAPSPQETIPPAEITLTPPSGITVTPPSIASPGPSPTPRPSPGGRGILPENWESGLILILATLGVTTACVISLWEIIGPGSRRK